MNRLSVFAAVLFLSACTTQEQRERDRLTDLIETRVELPKGAGKLADYARYYAFDEHGMVVGVYVPGYEAPNGDDKCEEFLEDFSTREVPCPPEARGDELLAGQRKWVEGTDRLPMISDGGCGIVNVTYDPKAGVVQDVYCNGAA